MRFIKEGASCMDPISFAEALVSQSHIANVLVFSGYVTEITKKPKGQKNQIRLVQVM